MSVSSKAGERFIRTAKARLLGAPDGIRELPFQREMENVPDDEKFKTLNQWKFLPGDRVLIAKGEKKGTVTKIFAYKEDANKFILENGPTMTLPVPKPLWGEQATGHINQQPKGVARDCLKLVVKMPDEVTGEDHDVIVHDFGFSGKHYNKHYKTIMPTRVVKHHGEQLVLPWPLPEEPIARSAAANEDTNSERTYYVDSVVANQIPKDALATIRNPRSKHRRGVFETRHKNKFVGPEMPLSDTKTAYLAELDAKRKLGHHKLTPELKLYIGDRVKQHVDNQKKQLGIN